MMDLVLEVMFTATRKTPSLSQKSTTVNTKKILKKETTLGWREMWPECLYRQINNSDPTETFLSGQTYYLHGTVRLDRTAIRIGSYRLKDDHG